MHRLFNMFRFASRVPFRTTPALESAAVLTLTPTLAHRLLDLSDIKLPEPGKMTVPSTNLL